MSESTFNPKNITSGLPLLPFTNQVGGHASIFRFSKRAICKPASQKEQEFYEYFESHRPDVLPFLSQYLGVLNVTYHHNPKHYDLPEVLFDQNEQLLKGWMKGSNNSPTTPSAAIYANMLEEGLEDFQQWSPNPDQCTLRFKDFQKRVFSEVFNPNALKERMAAVDGWRDKQNIKKNAGGDEDGNSHNKKSSSILMMTPITGNEENNNEESSSSSSTSSHSSSPAPQPRLLQRRPTDPWSVQVYERDRQKLQQLTKENNVTRQFILLEDLTDGVQFPCVLDLKMGTRQYGVDVNEEKKNSQAEKCAKSTSQSLGVRLCGMQVYVLFYFSTRLHIHPLIAL
ncbi:SAICAR synthase-like protein [Backusella circina FSU 941]|nr:SAICAR synthase-like protein [Backusella circina FSU 941]